MAAEVTMARSDLAALASCRGRGVLRRTTGRMIPSGRMLL